MYLKMKNSSNTTQTTAYALYDSGPKPYLKVNKSKVLPLTASTTTGFQLKAKLGTKTYRPLQKVTQNSISTSSTTTSATSIVPGMTMESNTTSVSKTTRTYISKFSTTDSNLSVTSIFYDAGTTTTSGTSLYSGIQWPWYDVCKTVSVMAALNWVIPGIQTLSAKFEHVTSIDQQGSTASIYFDTNKNYYPVSLTNPVVLKSDNDWITALSTFKTRNAIWKSVTGSSIFPFNFRNSTTAKPNNVPFTISVFGTGTWYDSKTIAQNFTTTIRTAKQYLTITMYGYTGKTTSSQKTTTSHWQ